MKIEHSIILTLSEKEADVLKAVLGSLTDTQFHEICKIKGEDRMLMSDLYDLIPELEEE
jgi:hypothetical protein